MSKVQRKTFIISKDRQDFTYEKRGEAKNKQFHTEPNKETYSISNANVIDKKTMANSCVLEG